MLGTIKAAKLYVGLEVETALDPSRQPFLYDHAMDEIPLLPGVMGIEAFAELASGAAGLLGGADENGEVDYKVLAVEQVAYLRPFKFHRMQPQTLYLSVRLLPAGEGDLLAQCTLKSRRELPALAKGKVEGEIPIQEEDHFTGQVRLARAPVEPPASTNLPEIDTPPVPAGDIYRVYFHGPAYQVLEQVQVAGDRAVGRMADGLPPATDPAGAAELMAPRLIELCYQTAGVLEIKTENAMALPKAVGSVTVYQRPKEADGSPGASHSLYAVVQAGADGSGFDAQVCDKNGVVYLKLNGYQTVRLPGNASL
jgi:hypothetical protein